MTKVIEAQAQTERGHKGLSLGTFFCQALLDRMEKSSSPGLDIKM